MKLCVLKENPAIESRVAAIPETVAKFAALGFDVVIERGAGDSASFGDAAYREAGAAIAADAAAALNDADVVLRVHAPQAGELAHYKKGALLIGLLDPYSDAALLQRYAEAGIVAMSLELLPRISRSQYMDALSSQANLAGYKAVLDAVAYFPRAVPMMMTAAGTIKPARIFIMGAGVAGLQAIATARRLGAIVSATDVRPVAREQVESLGAQFVMVEDEESGEVETAGGYAREMSEDYKRRQAELIAQTISNQDIVICTALIPGRKAPVLVSEAMVESMRPGSVVVDLAVEHGGNCPLSRPGEVVEAHGVSVIGYRNVPGRLAPDASAMYARNLFNFIKPLVDDATATLALDREDELVKGTMLTYGGALVHSAFDKQTAPGEAT